MSIADALLAEFDQEMATTRKHLERVPAKDADWKPHAKSMTLGALAAHVAEVPSWIKGILTQAELDFNPPGGPAYASPTFESTPKLLAFFDEQVQQARAAIAATSDKDFQATWTLKSGGAAFFTTPRIAVMRSFVLNHLYHHRGQLTVYLRLRNVPVPQTYGPTADES
jgi:uncharacterized damage-inducible protein DinB